MEQLDRIEAKLDKIDSKLDNHAERLTRAEERLNAVKGFMRYSIIMFLGVVATLATTYWDKFLALILR